MERVKWIRHRDADILFIDMSNLQTTEEEVAVANEAERIIKGCPQQSVRTLLDYTGMHYDVTGVEAQKNYSAAVTPYVKASATIGMDGLKRVILRSVARITGRNIKAFDDLEAAKDWLAGQ
ncbi:MAG: hypothetical protein MUF78_09430 [Candidatus Edwardsbacteria bacterium]|jgi:hypothetical protein|nr:hypothetical protein [Candidatus Edwardsbacteria bacterium]